MKIYISDSVATTIKTMTEDSTKQAPSIPTTQYPVSPTQNALTDTNASTTTIIESGDTMCRFS